MKSKWLYLIALMMFVLDRASKMLLGGADVTVLGGFLRIARVENTGMAFGWMTGKTALLAVFTVVILAAVLWMMRGYSLRGCALIGAGMMLGGALGNLYDRLFVGHVIDLFDVTFVDFFVFNFADAGITLGAAALGVGILFRPKDFIKT